MSSYIAVFDVGKTNKKLMVFDEELQIVDTVRENFSEFTEDGINIEPVDEIKEWFLTQLSKFGKKYAIQAISITTHGATTVCIDREGKVALPVVAYTTEPGDSFQEEFYSNFGTPEELQVETCTAIMGSLLNQGRQIYFMQKTYPEQFERVKWILNFPQYFGYVLTGNVGAEPTLIGCHSLMWEHKKKRWSRIASELGVMDKLPEKISKSWEVLGTVSDDISKQTGLSKDTIVTLGVHDSNASFLPYIVQTKEKFVLNSTGTWCVIMHPSETLDFGRDEIGKMVFYNLDVFSNPVKTSLLMGGLEFEKWSGILKEINGEDGYPEFDPGLYRKVIWEKELFIFPSVQKGTGQFPDSEPRVYAHGKEYLLKDIEAGVIPDFFKDYPTAFAALNLSLAIQSKVALERAGAEDGMSIFVEGGFRNNPDYNTLLSALFPKSKVALTNLNEATAFGAAMLAKAALKGVTPKELSSLYQIESKAVPSEEFDGLGEYMEKFFRLL